MESSEYIGNLPPHEDDLKGLLTAIVDSSEDAIISETFDGTITTWSAGAERIFGFSAAEALGNNISIIIPAERLPEVRDILARVRSGEQVEHFETVCVKKDGRRININLTVSPVRNSAQKIIGASNLARDITTRIEMERLRGLLTAIIESSDHAVIGETFDSVITTWNAGAERIFGYSAAEVTGRHSSIIIPAEKLEEARDILARVRKGERIEHFETTRIRKDGQHVEIDLTVSGLRLHVCSTHSSAMASLVSDGFHASRPNAYQFAAANGWPVQLRSLPVLATPAMPVRR